MLWDDDAGRVIPQTHVMCLQGRGLSLQIRKTTQDNLVFNNIIMKETNNKYAIQVYY